MTDPEELLLFMVRAEMSSFMPEIARDVVRAPRPPLGDDYKGEDVRRLGGCGEKGVDKLTKKKKKKKWFGFI